MACRVCGILLAVCVTCAAVAQDGAGAGGCTKIAGAAERLACYDAAFGVPVRAAAPSAGVPAVAVPGGAESGTAASSAASGDTPVRAAPAPGGTAAFGDDGHLAASTLKKTESLPRSITATIVAATTNSRGLYRLTLDNGQVWDTLQSNWMLEFKSSDTVTVSRLPLGSYQISYAGQGRSVGAKRIR